MSVAARVATKRLIRRDVLEGVSRPLLVRLLAPHQTWLAEHGLSLDALACPQPDLDRDAPLRQLYTLLTRGAAVPAELRDALVDVDALATPAGHDEIQRLAAARGSLGPASGLCPADHAFTAWLDHRPLFEAARVVIACDAVTRFVEIDACAVPALDRLDQRAEELSEALSGWFAARNRTPYVDVLPVETEADVLFEIVHGQLPRAQSELDGALRRSHRTTRLTRRDHVVIDRRTGRLAVQACSPGEREAYRQAFGRVLLGDADAFTPRPLLTLAPLLNGPVAPVPGVLAVRLLGLTLFHAPGRTTTIADKVDLTPYLGSDAGQAALEGASPCAAVLGLVVHERRLPLRVELAAPSGLRFDRRDARMEATVRSLLTARGLLAAPARRASLLQEAS